MSGLLRGSPRGLAAVRMALSGAAVSLALGALSSGARGVTFFCDDDTTNHNFTCGANAVTINATESTAVGDGANASGGPSDFTSGATAVGRSAIAQADLATAVGRSASANGDRSTAIGNNASADSSSTAVGADSIASNS